MKLERIIMPEEVLQPKRLRPQVETVRPELPPPRTTACIEGQVISGNITLASPEGSQHGTLPADTRPEHGSLPQLSQFVDAIKTGGILDEWAQLPYIERLRVMFLVERLREAFTTLHAQHPSDTDPLVRRFNIDALEMDVLLFGFGKLPATAYADDPILPLLLEQRDLAQTFADAIASIEKSGKLNNKPL